jgi:hypothetical protein
MISCRTGPNGPLFKICRSPLPFIRGRAMAEGPAPKFHAISAGKCSVVGMIEPGSSA